jgi:large subunit ribosomal protein L6
MLNSIFLLKMKKSLFREIEVPKDVEIEIKNNLFIIKGPEGEDKREFKIPKLLFKKDKNKIIIGNEKSTKKEKRLMNTIFSHIENMIKGVQKKFIYEMKICSSHFPMSVEINENELIVKNFFGEKKNRIYKFSKDVNISKEGENLKIESINKEKAGQTAASIERLTRITKRDKRIFQDGIYIISKNGRKI